MPPTGGATVPTRGVRESYACGEDLAPKITIRSKGAVTPRTEPPRKASTVRGPAVQERAVPRRRPRAAALRAAGTPKRKAARPVAGTRASVGHPGTEGGVGTPAPRVPRPLESERVALQRLAAGGAAIAGPVRTASVLVGTQGVRKEVPEAGARKGRGPPQGVTEPRLQLGQMAAVAAPTRRHAGALPVLEAAPTAPTEAAAARQPARVPPGAKRTPAEVRPVEAEARHGAAPKSPSLWLRQRRAQLTLPRHLWYKRVCDFRLTCFETSHLR